MRIVVKAAKLILERDIANLAQWARFGGGAQPVKDVIAFLCTDMDKKLTDPKEHANGFIVDFTTDKENR